MGLRVGVLHDVLPADGGEVFARLLRTGFDELCGAMETPRLDIVTVIADGAPRAGEDAVRTAFADLMRRDVAAVVGPAITDSALAIVAAADQAGCPTINYAGSHRARGQHMFQYQVGSLEEEPYLLAAHLDREDLRRVGVVRETSIIGSELFSFLNDACRRSRLVVAAVADIGADGAGAAAAVAALSEARVDAVVYLGLGLSARALGEAAQGLSLPIVANSALLFGHAVPEWTALWEGWTYVDVFDEDNRVLAALRREFPDVGAAVSVAIPYDLGRLLGAAAALTAALDRTGMAAALEQVKRLPAALGRDGTRMGFGRWDRGALKGDYLVLRTWRAGRSVRC
jgi:ABC-type branched-subunit amino acid transport system substrate-binding protein